MTTVGCAFGSSAARYKQTARETQKRYQTRILRDMLNILRYLHPIKQIMQLINQLQNPSYRGMISASHSDCWVITALCRKFAGPIVSQSMAWWWQAKIQPPAKTWASK